MNGYISSSANTTNSYTNQPIWSYEGQPEVSFKLQQSLQKSNLLHHYNHNWYTDTLPIYPVQTSLLTLLTAAQTAPLTILTARRGSQAWSEARVHLINDHYQSVNQLKSGSRKNLTGFYLIVIHVNHNKSFWRQEVFSGTLIVNESFINGTARKQRASQPINRDLVNPSGKIQQIKKRERTNSCHPSTGIATKITRLFDYFWVEFCVI